MEISQAVSTLLTTLGYGSWIPVILAGVGFFSAVATVYPTTWPGASALHKAALLFGNAKPAVTPSQSTLV